MTSVRDEHKVFAQSKPFSHWQQRDPPGPVAQTDSHWPIVLQREPPPRPVEPGAGLSPRGSYTDATHGPPKQQLPGVQELLTPSIRDEDRAPSVGSWLRNSSTQIWHDRVLPSLGQGLPNGSPSSLGPMNRHLPEKLVEDPYSRSSVHLLSGGQPPQTMPALPLRRSGLSSPVARNGLESMPQVGEYFAPSSSYYSTITGNPHDGHLGERRTSSVFPGKLGGPAGLFSLQIVGQRDIPGEGLCYVFKDGTTCPTIIDGEPVNPLWGTTKAGKARKRLAQACLNCREKKIRCEPGESSCLQCEKAKRECLKPSAAQTQADLSASTSFNTSPERDDWKYQTSPRTKQPSDAPAPKRRRSAHAAQQEIALDQTSTGDDSPSMGQKRRLSGDTSPILLKQPNDRKDSKRGTTEDLEWAPSKVYRDTLDSLPQSEDPYQFEPEGTMLFLDLFFAQVARETRIIFPRHAFRRWVRNCDSRYQSECMVLYSVLAVGSAFSNGRFSSFSKMCVDRATQAVASSYGRFSLALIQSRLLLGAYYHLQGKGSISLDYTGAALCVVAAMRLNTEDGCGENLDEQSRRVFSFTREQLRESRRRTFWAAFLVDRYNTSPRRQMNTINEDDVQTRLPCAEQVYEDGSPSSASLLQDIGSSTTDAHSATAYVITASTLWKDVMQFLHRSIHLPRSTYRTKFESFQETMQRRLYDWQQTLPQHFKYSREELDQAIHRGYAGDFLAMHTLYLFSQLKLSRMIRHELLPMDVVARSICAAHSHALQLLALLCDVTILIASASNIGIRTTDLMSPFIAQAMSFAIDTLGAGGLREEIVTTQQVLSIAIEVLRDLSQHCVSTWILVKKAEKRLTQIESWPSELDIRAGRGQTRRCWRTQEPMDKAPPLEQDVMYGVSSAIFSEALTEGR
ncbi:hypothetical protein AAFC00_003292 [Neodothiora populina]|uniref:Zn(2)-C6 fungal-type domain-containing protein n=1 Tax=Neodothiora populina TaxID=2781224 RepID=A0ABR3PA74_9PEZI